MTPPRFNRRAALLALSAWATEASTQSDVDWHRTSVQRRFPVQVPGGPVMLDFSIYKPEGLGPFPTVVFHHGSTGFGLDTQAMRKRVDIPPVGLQLAELGWAVVFPARRGRANSDGEYDEGFSVPRALGYSCLPFLARPGFDRGTVDATATTALAKTLPFVDVQRLVLGGHSRGAALAMALAANAPGAFRGIVNFCGSWLGRPCPNAAGFNARLMSESAKTDTPMLWLYASRDRFLALEDVQAMHQEFNRLGGRAELRTYTVAEPYGHDLPRHVDLWRTDVEAFLSKLATPAPRTGAMNTRQFPPSHRLT